MKVSKIFITYKNQIAPSLVILQEQRENRSGLSLKSKCNKSIKIK